MWYSIKHFICKYICMRIINSLTSIFEKYLITLYDTQMRSLVCALKIYLYFHIHVYIYMYMHLHSQCFIQLLTLRLAFITNTTYLSFFSADFCIYHLFSKLTNLSFSTFLKLQWNEWKAQYFYKTRFLIKL